MQITKVTAAIISEAASAETMSYSAIVKPTESASMEVAIPCIISAPKPTPVLVQGASPLSFMPSASIFPPIAPSSISAIHGISFSKERKYRTTVCTQTQPVIGISA